MSGIQATTSTARERAFRCNATIIIDRAEKAVTDVLAVALPAFHAWSTWKAMEPRLDWLA